MRKTTMITTKTHFLCVVEVSGRDEEITFSSETTSNGTAIGFLAEGAAKTFTKTKEEHEWTQYGRHEAPLLYTRSYESFFGAVSDSEETLVVLVIPREEVATNKWEDLTSGATESEINSIKTTEETFQIENECRSDVARDTSSFAPKDNTKTKLNTNVQDSEIIINFETGFDDPKRTR